MTDNYSTPRTLDEALQLLAEKGPEPTLLAGGTDVMVWIQSGSFKPDRVIDIWGLRPECAHVEDRGDTIAIGALATYSEILESATVQAHLPAFAEACAEIGARQIQNRGTMGGNIGGSSPAGDTLPCLLAYDARVVLASTAGTRSVAYENYCTGYRQTEKRADELITEILFPKPTPTTKHYWCKAGTRLAQSISKVMVAGCGEMDGDRIGWVRVAAGSVGPVPLLLDEVSSVVAGQKLDGDLLADARKAARSGIAPIDDVRSTAQYRSTVAANLVARFLEGMAS